MNSELSSTDDEVCEPQSNPTHRTIHWFKKGLRLHDNPALLHAVNTSKTVYPVFVFDEAFIFQQDKDNAGKKRLLFLMDALQDLRNSLKKIGSNLYIFMGDTQSVLKNKVKEWNITQFTYIFDTEVHFRERDKQVKATLQEMGINVVSKVGHTLYDIDKIWTQNNGMPLLTYRKFLDAVASRSEPPLPVRTIQTHDFLNKEVLTCEDDTKRYEAFTDKKLAGFDRNRYGWHGGETHALERFKLRCDFQKGLELPAKTALQNSSTTGLSPYFCLGCISPRMFYHTMKTIKAEARKHCLTPKSLMGQIIWRDFFYCVAAYTPNFTRMKGNPICLQISWAEDEKLLESWRYGVTGYPWIDANMRQLKKEGWINHLGRDCVACFLTRGNLWLNWEEGQKVFEQYLLDADYSINAGNWLWLSASAFYHKFNKIFHPVYFGKRTDPTGEYVRKFVPELAKYPHKYIYEPWKAPLEVQIEANCIIGRDYPQPVVDHETSSQKNLERMRRFRSQQEDTINMTIDSFDYSKGKEVGSVSRSALLDKEGYVVRPPRSTKRAAALDGKLPSSPPLENDENDGGSPPKVTRTIKPTSTSKNTDNNTVTVAVARENKIRPECKLS